MVSTSKRFSLSLTQTPWWHIVGVHWVPMEIDFTVVAGVSICLSSSERNVVWLWGGRGGVFQKGVREELKAKRIKLLGRLYKLN